MSTTDCFGNRRYSDIANLKKVISVDEKMVVKWPIVPIIELEPLRGTYRDPVGQCINIVNLSHRSPSSVEANTDVIHNQRKKSLKVASVFLFSHQIVARMLL